MIGCGKSRRLRILFRDIFNPSLLIIFPTHSTSRNPKKDFEGLRSIPCLPRRRKTVRKFTIKSSSVDPNTVISSKYISQYFNKWDEMLRQQSMTPIERDVWLFAMYYDFMSYVAQNLRAMYETGKSISEGRNDWLRERGTKRWSGIEREEWRN